MSNDQEETKVVPNYEQPWNEGHQHGDFDTGGFCNRLVLDEPDGCGDGCDYQIPEAKELMDASRAREAKFSAISQRILWNDFERSLIILQEQIDHEPCWYDHNGGCQAHGYISLEPGQICGTLEAQQLLAKYGYTTEGEQSG